MTSLGIQFYLKLSFRSYNDHRQNWGKDKEQTEKTRFHNNFSSPLNNFKLLWNSIEIVFRYFTCKFNCWLNPAVRNLFHSGNVFFQSVLYLFPSSDDDRYTIESSTLNKIEFLIIWDNLSHLFSDLQKFKNNVYWIVRDPNFDRKSIAKAKRKRNFFRKKMRSESEANTKFFSAKRSEANPLRFAIFRNKAKKSENFCKFIFILLGCKILRVFFKFALYFQIILCNC